MSRRPSRLKFPDHVAPLVADIEASRVLTRGQLAQAAGLLKLDVPMNLVSDDGKRRKLTLRQATKEPVTRASMAAFSELAVPDGEAAISVSGASTHEVTLRNTERFAYANGKETEPDWYDESATHSSCDHAAWLLAILSLRFGMPKK